MFTLALMSAWLFAAVSIPAVLRSERTVYDALIALAVAVLAYVAWKRSAAAAGARNSELAAAA